MLALGCRGIGEQLFLHSGFFSDGANGSPSDQFFRKFSCEQRRIFNNSEGLRFGPTNIGNYQQNLYFPYFFLFVICHKFQSANSGIFKTLGDQVRQHPDRILSTASETIQKLETGRYAFPYVRMYLLHA